MLDVAVHDHRRDHNGAAGATSAMEVGCLLKPEHLEYFSRVCGQITKRRLDVGDFELSQQANSEVTQARQRAWCVARA